MPEESISPLDLVVASHLRWGFVFQRPQHLLSRAAAHQRVFFVEEPVFGAETPRMEVRAELQRLWVAVPHLPEGLPPEHVETLQSELLAGLLQEQGIRDYVLWYYTPMAVGFTRELRPRATVYDCMDELSAFAEAPSTLRDREGELFDSADLVFTGGRSLYESKRRRHARVHCFPSSVETAHFGRARVPGPDPQDQAPIPHPRLGFFGVIDERFDRDLLAGVADLRPDWHLVMLGPVVKIDPALLPSRPNIHYLGQKSYDELPDYARGWDVALMPFARNEATRFISPTKTPEYLAAGLPVVSTAIPDVVAHYGDRGLAHIADDPEAFVAAVEAALNGDAADRVARADALLAEQSWDRTWAQMWSLIAEVALGRAADAATVGVRPDAAAEPVGGDSVAPPLSGSAAPNGGGANGSHAEITPGNGLSVRVVDERAPADGFDYIVVGAGFAGSVLAERLASQDGKRVLVVEKRTHIGGNAYDHYDDAGILVHRYGPHIFHTNSREVFDYLSQFTEWRTYEHRVRASVDGQLVPIPINLDTINRLYGMSLDSRQLEDFFASVAEPIEHPKTSEDVVVKRVGRELYEKFFRNYTRKQWGLDPSELDATVTARVPVRTNRDDRYFTDTYQAMPRHGYTRIFERMLAHPRIKVLLNTDHREIRGLIPYDEMIYTGPIDEFFDFRFGKLPYRSLEFRHETHEVPVWQPAPVVNYPNEHAFTRITEFKYLTGQEHPKTSIVYEYPRAEGDPYYPVPRPQNAALYKQYKELAKETPGVHFVGRLATYKYYNMDQVVAQALAVHGRISTRALPDDADKVEVDGAISPATRAVGGRRVHVQSHRRSLV